MKTGEVDYAMYSLQLAWRYKIMGGENLSVALKAVGDRIQLMVRVFSIIDWLELVMHFECSCLIRLKITFRLEKAH